VFRPPKIANTFFQTFCVEL